MTGIQIVLVSDETRKEIFDVIDKTYNKINELVSQYKEGTLPLTRGLSPEESLELYVVNEPVKSKR